MSGLRTVLALTQGQDVPSSRFRWRQHEAWLRAQGLEAHELPARHGAYPPPQAWRRPAWGLRAWADSWQRVRQTRDADLCFLQRHLIATLHTAERALQLPYVFDVDDAIFLGPRGESANTIARRAALTLCGNAFLAEHFASFGPVRVLPTAVDTARFCPAPPAKGPLVIGWSGSSSGFAYLLALEDALRQVLRRHPEARLRVVADAAPPWRTLPPEQVEFRRWNAATEVAELQGFHIGLMPLDDSPWARGKCSFKMLSYMACGLPVVVSPVGMNAEVLALGALGLGPRHADEWVQALDLLLRDAEQRAALGRMGRQVAEQHYSRERIGTALLAALREAHGAR
ncbi:MAG: glycosyltransferase family 4 protein [Inhella sp.]